MPLTWLSQQRQLPESSTFVSVLIVLLTGLLACLCIRHRVRNGSRLPARLTPVLVAVITGLVVGWIRIMMIAPDAIDQILPESLEGVDISIRGEIRQVSVLRTGVTRIEFDVQPDQGRLRQLPDRLRLNWYSSERQPVPRLRPGEVWQLSVRLKRFHSTGSPAAFDSEGWAFRRGFGATGYIRNGQPLSRNLATIRSLVSRLRVKAQTFIHQQIENPVSSGIIRGLAVGDRSALTTATWQTLERTGTTHLIAISGLHVGLAALWGGVVIGIVWRRWTYLMRTCPLPVAQAVVAILLGTAYAVLAGLALPTQRALVMLTVFALARLLKRHIHAGRAIVIALLLVLVLDPLAVSEPGLWLSFFAVTAIWLAIRAIGINWQKPQHPESLLRRCFSAVDQWLRVQILLTIALTPVLLFLFNQVSLVSVPANLFAIPMMAFLIVPIVLLALTVLLFDLQWLAGYIFELAALLVEVSWWLLEWLANLPTPVWQRPTPTTFELLLAAVGVLACLVPAAVHGRRWLLLAWVPLLIVSTSNLADDELEVAVLDVGQGLAIIVRSAERVLVYDTGIAYPQGFSAARSIVIPYLIRMGIRKIDRLVISHPDSDHAAGMGDLVAAFPIGRILVGPEVASKNAAHCRQGTRWHWRNTQFSILSPGSESGLLTGNDASCVLRIDHGAVSVLLTGDIEKHAERLLVAHQDEALGAEILIMGHHGSRTSSTQAFLEQVQPQVGVVSAGYRNRHGHPAAEVVERAKKLGISVERTDLSGTIAFRIKPTGFRILRYREILRRYWHHS